MNYIYCGHCYALDSDKPFGFCNECWVENGKPEAMKGD